MTTLDDRPLVLEPVRSIPDGVPAENRTLGWSVLEWVTDWLLQPDGPQAGEPFSFTPEQVRILLRWYEVDDAGRFVYTSGTLRRLKGWGKDPFTAVLALVEFAGPCRFGGWDANGMPLAVPHPAPWVQIVAVSKDQTRNTMRLFPSMMSDEFRAEFGIDAGKEIIYSRAGGVVEAVTSSPRALEGGRATFVIPNETQHWVQSNGGHEMWLTLQGNKAKARGGGARMLQITNAPQPGEDSIAEQTLNAWLKIAEGKARDPGMYYDSVEAPGDVDLHDPQQLRAGIVAARGDSTWLDVDWIMSTIYDGTYPASRARRMFLNQLTAAEDSLLAPAAWDACLCEDLLSDGDEVVLGFDGGRKDDATALVAMRVSDRLAVPLGIWERPDGPAGEGWEVNREWVDGTVRRAVAQFRVVAFFADVALWESYVDQWSQDFREQLVIKASSKSTVGRDMRGGLEELTKANERLVAAIEDGKFRHNGDRTLRRHALNARRRPNRWGLSFGKESRESNLKVDGYAALLLADLARHRFLESGKQPEKPRSGAVFFL